MKRPHTPKITFWFIAGLVTFVFGISLVSFWALRNSPRSEKPEGLILNNAEWQKIDMEGRFSFYLPHDMKRRSNTGTSCSNCYVREYSNSSIEVYADYNSSNRCAHSESAQESLVKIDGKKAKLGVYHSAEPRVFITYVCIPDIGDGKTSSGLSILYKYQYESGTANKIINSIKFP